MTTQTKKPYTPSANEIETFSGHYLDVSKPDPDKINLEDIAHGLSNLCRYGGQCKRFYSVAEHSVFVSKRLERKGYSRDTQLLGLHHDDAEAYLGDIPRPLKPLIGRQYTRLSNKMDRAIVKALDLGLNAEDHFHHPVVKAADDWAVHVEARNLMTSEGRGWSGHPQGRAELIPERIVVPNYFLGGLIPEEARDLFLDRHEELIK